MNLYQNFKTTYIYFLNLFHLHLIFQSVVSYIYLYNILTNTYFEDVSYICLIKNIENY